jgi:hypothetical protein
MTNRLPELPTATAPETCGERGARVLRWILAERVTATLSSVDLERADSAAIVAGCSATMSEACRANLSEMRHAIAATLRIRRELDKVSAPAPAGSPCERPKLGPMAPLSPAPISRPPAPAEIEINF